ncbi:hypothetical protein [Lysobacter sp. Root690]|uniref:hypothetical protein n=1 Tax=Lysobacter sp. Root690 TaxID=1736588 RepID=UPI0012F81932|nr:hypothetical protein [Lysobacter sp. Root690]
MPSCLVRYRVVIASRGPLGADPAHGVVGTAVVDEEWEPDEWGDPGRCVRRRALVELRGDGGGCYLDRVRGRSGFWRITGAKIDGPVLWAHLDCEADCP